MRRRVIKTLMRRTPLKSFLISVTNGDRFEIRHPEAAYLARQFIAVVHPSNRTDTAEGTAMVWIDYKHIVHCQPIVSKEVPF